LTLSRLSFSNILDLLPVYLSRNGFGVSKGYPIFVAALQTELPTKQSGRPF
jgi:hypothetical protein